MEMGYSCRVSAGQSGGLLFWGLLEKLNNDSSISSLLQAGRFGKNAEILTPAPFGAIT
jgi:hypothetical protein